MTIGQMKKQGFIKEYEGIHYITDDGRIIRRVYTSKRISASTKWWVEGENHIHRNLVEAYYDDWKVEMPKYMEIANY